MQPHLALQAGDEPEEGQPEQDREQAEHDVDDVLVAGQHRAEAAEQRAAGDEDGAEAGDEQHGAGEHAPRRTGATVRTSVSPSAGAPRCDSASCSPDRPVTNDR